MTPRRNWEYWSVDAPGLDEAGAVELAKQAVGLGSVVSASIVDPQYWLTRHLDPETTEMVLRAFGAALASGVLSPSDAEGVEQMLDDYRGWLEAYRRGDGN